MTASVWPGELLRWYLTRASHPFKKYIVGHYWWLFEKLRVWIRYDDRSIIKVCLGEYIQQRIFFDRYYERPLVEWLQHTLRDDDVFWDVGANIGAVTLVAARRCRQVVSFEPDPRSFARLRQNIEVNGIRNVELVQAALDETSGQTTLIQAAGSNTGMSTIAPPSAAAEGALLVRTVTGDEFVHAHPLLAPTVMKIDVEGAEHRVLRGAVELLGSGRLKAVIFEDRSGSDGAPSNRPLLTRFGVAGYRIEPLGPSAEGVGDGMFNYIATPLSRSGTS